MQTRLVSLTAAMMLATSLCAIPAFSAGGGGGGGETISQCRKGMVWDKMTRNASRPAKHAG